MCDAGRLNYKWIGREDRLGGSPKSEVRSPKSTWSLGGGFREIADKLKQAPAGRSPSSPRRGRRTRNLYLLAKLAKKLGALTDSVAAHGEGTSCC